MSSFDGLRADIVWEANTGQAIAELGAVGDEYARTTGAMSDQALRLAAAQDRLTASIKRSGPESRAAKTATIAYREELAAVAQQANATSAAVSRQAEAQARASKVAADAALKNQLAAARSVGHTLTTYISVPTALVGAAAVKMAFDFEAATRLIQTQAGATAGEVELVRKGILDLVKSGDSFGQTATDMAKGLFAIESEGIRGGKALDILRVAAAGAAVGQTDLAQTANALTSVMRVYGLDANQAAGAMSTLNAAVGAGKLHMEDLNAALATKFLPTAKQLGITLPQALAALDVFTRAGIPANVAANNLTTAFIKMEAPTKAAAASLLQLGLSNTQLATDLQRGGLPAALADLVKGYDKLERTQGKVAANQAVFGAFGGSRGGAPILALVQQYQSYLQGLQQAQRQANPATFWKEVAATMHEPSLKVKEDVAKITASLVDLGNKLAPIVADVAGGVDKIAAAFARLPGPAKHELGAIILLLAVGGPLLKSIVGTVKAVRTIEAAFRGVPRAAGPAIAKTDAEMGTLSATAARTGAKVGTELEAGVVSGTAAAETRIAGLRSSLLGLASKVFVITMALSFVPPSKGGQKALDQAGLGFLGHLPVIGGVEQQIGRAGYAANQKLASLTGDSDAQIAARKRRGEQRRYDATHPGFPSFEVWKLTHPHGTRAEYEAEKRLDYDFKHPHSKQARADARDANRAPHQQDGGGGGGRDRRRGPSLTQIQLSVSAAELAIARGDKGAQAQLTRALEQEIAYDRGQERRQEDLLRRHVGDRQKHIQALEAARADESSALDQIKSGKTSAGSAAASRRSGADTTREAKLGSEVSAAQSAEKSARTVKGERSAYERERNARKLLLALYEREAHDKSLTRSQRASAERKAAAERKTLAGLEDKSRDDELAFAVLQAKNAVAAATVGSKAYEQAVKAEDKALAAQIAYYDKRAHNAKLSVEARKKSLEKELAARKQKTALDKTEVTSKAATQAELQQFLTSVADIYAKFAGNIIQPGSSRGDTHLYESVHELRQIKGHVARIGRMGRFPTGEYQRDASVAVAG